MLGEVAMATALAAIKIARSLANSGVAFCALLNLSARLEERFDLRVYILGFHLVTPSLFSFDVQTIYATLYRRNVFLCVTMQINGMEFAL